MSADISPVIANHVLHFFNRDEGFTPGGFFSAFYELLAKADAENVNRLAEGFPRQVNAFLLARNSDEGMNQLREIAKPKLIVL
jgi:hypothetical protein